MVVEGSGPFPRQFYPGIARHLDSIIVAINYFDEFAPKLKG